MAYARKIKGGLVMALAYIHPPLNHSLEFSLVVTRDIYFKQENKIASLNYYQCYTYLLFNMTNASYY